MKNLWIWIAIIAVAAVGYFTVSRAPAETTEIKIGVIAPLTGIAADYGAEMKAGIEAAGGTNVEFIYEDDKCDPKEAVSAYRKLIDFDKVGLIIGPACGSPQEAIAPLMKDSSVIAVVPSAAPKAIYAASGENMYDMQYALETEGRFLAQKLLELGYKNVALISYQNAFSKTLTDSFKVGYKGEIAKEISFAGTEKDISSGLLKLKGTEYDAIISTDISFFFAQGLEKLRLLGLEKPVFSSYAVELPAVRPLVEGVAYSFPGDSVENGKGAIYNIAKESVEFLVAQARACRGDYACMKARIGKTGSFDDDGAILRTLVLKRIKDGKPQAY